MGEAAYMWRIYSEIKKGCNEVTYSAIANFGNVTGQILTPIEAELMIDIDLVRRKHG